VRYQCRNVDRRQCMRPEAVDQNKRGVGVRVRVGVSCIKMEEYHALGSEANLNWYFHRTHTHSLCPVGPLGPQSTSEALATRRKAAVRASAVRPHPSVPSTRPQPPLPSHICAVGAPTGGSVSPCGTSYARGDDAWVKTRTQIDRKNNRKFSSILQRRQKNPERW